MCGICGIVWNDPSRETPPDLIDAMTDALVHRGPDGGGIFEAPGVALGHRRLSIIDLEGGLQPLANEDHSIWVTFNGEIYNFQTLRDELERKGHRFRTRSDTEVLVHLYEEMGVDMLDGLRGMFAFAIWDEPRRRLFLARDRLGKKPLVYWHNGEGLRFASELKAIWMDPRFPREVDPRAIDDYLTYQYVPHPETIYRSARKLPPGHYLVHERGEVRIERYWLPDFHHPVEYTLESASERVRHELTEAIRLRLISDVPLGAFLSGGIDSTIVVGLMQRLSNQPVRTFSIGFPIKEFDERSFARQAAEHLGTQHEEFVVEPDAVDVVTKLSWYYDEPFADSSAIPTYYVSRLSRQKVTVALTGDAGDELFAGYPRYRAVRIGAWFDRLPAALRWLVANEAWQRIPASTRQKSRRRQIKKLLRYLSRPPAERYRQWISIFDDPSREALYSDAFREALHGHRSAQWIDDLFSQIADRDPVTQASIVDILSYLPGDLFTKVDIASMANSLECRCPFVDHQVVEFAGRLSIGLKMRGMRQKHLLKHAFADLLPPALRNRPKMGFGVPIDHWLRVELAEMVHDLLGPGGIGRRGWFVEDRVRQLIDDHLERRWDHSYRLWALMMLELWARQYLDQGPRVAPSTRRAIRLGRLGRETP